MRNVIATDVGGTTFKVAIIEDGRWGYSRETILNQYQLRLPMIDVASIGAGGGSIAWVDGRRLRIGPQSASASAGPGVLRPWWRGAHGHGCRSRPWLPVRPIAFSAGAWRCTQIVPRKRSVAASPSRCSAVTCWPPPPGIRSVIDNQMGDLIRKSTLERGYDARDFVMMAYGGAGPVHAASYGAEVGVSEIVIPFFATVHSAYGAAQSDVRFSLQHSHPLVLPVAPSTVERSMRRWRPTARGVSRKPMSRRRSNASSAGSKRAIDARCTTCGCQRLRSSTTPGSPPWRRASMREYERLFGKGAALRDAGVELVNYGVYAIGMVPRIAPELAPTGGSAEPRASRMTYCPLQSGMVSTPIYEGPNLPAGTELVGPAIIEHPGTNIVVLRGQTARIDDWRHTHILIKSRMKGNA